MHNMNVISVLQRTSIDDVDIALVQDKALERCPFTNFLKVERFVGLLGEPEHYTILRASFVFLGGLWKC